MIIDGKKLAEDIKMSLKEEVGKIGKKLRLAVVKVGTDSVTEKFLREKKRFGEAVGIDVRIYELPVSTSTNELRGKLAEIVHIKENTGVIVQLPLPSQINTQYILDGIIPEKDPDMLSSKSLGLFYAGRSQAFPPVVAAIDHIFKTCSVEIKGKNITVFGAGRLVGKPVATWLINEGAMVSVLNEYTKDYKLFTINSDVVISGVGRQNLITADMVKNGVVAIDCGTSEAFSTGRIVGDFDSAVQEKASIFTPVPGGVGPLTVAMLFKNLAELSRR